MKFTLLIAPLVIVTVGTLSPLLCPKPTASLGLLGNDAERVVLCELAKSLNDTPDTSLVTVTWSEGEGLFVLPCRARYEPERRRLVSRTRDSEIEFFPVTPEAIREIATRRLPGSFALAESLSQKKTH